MARVDEATRRVRILKGICSRFTNIDPQIYIRGDEDKFAYMIVFQGQVPSEEECNNIARELKRNETIRRVNLSSSRSSRFVSWVVKFAS